MLLGNTEISSTFTHYKFKGARFKKFKKKTKESSYEEANPWAKEVFVYKKYH